jgi:nucleoside-diphosphate-sugar epimerase
MNVLVTGGSGFIGQKLVAYLIGQGCSVSVVSRQETVFDKDVRLIKMDLLTGSFSFLENENFDVVINCAADLKNNEVMEGLHVNVPLRMLKFLRGRNCRWVQLSSVGVYGSKMRGVIDETSLFNPKGEYEVTKARAEQEISEYCNKNDIPFSILRPSNVFGIEMVNTSLRKLIEAIKFGRFFYMAKPECVSMNYVDVDNVVEGLWLCSTKKEADGQAYNLSDRIDQKEFVAIVCNEYGVSPPSLFIPGFIMRLLCHLFAWLPGFPLTPAAINALTTKAEYPTQKIERDLGFRLKSPLPQALEAFIKALD